MIRTGSIGLDIALGGGWIPGIHEIWGDSGSGKTVLALHAAENVTRARRETLWIDTVDGVAHMDNAPQVVVARPRNAEGAFQVAEMACWEEGIDLIVVDSANMLVRQRELDGDPTYEPHPQREYKDELKELKWLTYATGTTVLFVSQPRDKQRQPVRGTGISEKATFRVHLHADVVHQDGTREIQATARAGKVVNHDAARFTVIPGKGIDRALEIVSCGVEHGVIWKNGTWLSWNDIQAQGTAGLARALNPHMMQCLENEIRAIVWTS